MLRFQAEERRLLLRPEEMEQQSQKEKIEVRSRRVRAL
jgi:hypothetical protein